MEAGAGEIEKSAEGFRMRIPKKPAVHYVTPTGFEEEKGDDDEDPTSPNEADGMAHDADDSGNLKVMEQNSSRTRARGKHKAKPKPVSIAKAPKRKAKGKRAKKAENDPEHAAKKKRNEQTTEPTTPL